MHRLFRLTLLAGATWRERALGALAALFGIGITAWISGMLVPNAGILLLIAGPIGASAVLVFIVPSSPLAQPWPVIGGNVVSALCGILVAQWLGATPFAAGVAVGAAILGMSVARCLHPPGGGSALLGVLGGDAVLSHGLSFALVPVGLNAALLVLSGILCLRLTGARYPNRAALAPPAATSAAAAPSFVAADIDGALADMGQSFDVSREDLQLLLTRANHHAAQRRKREAVAAGPKRRLLLLKLLKRDR